MKGWLFCQVLWLVQPGIFGFGGDEDSNFRVGLFPQREEIPIRRARPGGVAQESIGPGNAQTRQRARRGIRDHATMMEHFLELHRRFLTVRLCKVCFTSEVS